MSKNHTFITLLIIILGFAIYFPTLSNSFVWDDNLLITDNSFIKDFKHIFDMFKTELFYCAGGNTSFYRPVQSLSFMLDYRLWRLEPFGYHLTNIILHIFNSILVYLLVFILFKDKRASILASLLFLTHPVQVEAVAYISGRADLLAMLFFILSFIFYIKYRDNAGRLSRNFVLSILFYMTALLSKEAALILPAVLLFYEMYFYENKKHGIAETVKSLSVYVLATLGYIILRFTALSFKKIPVLENGFHGLFFRTLTAFKAFFYYIALLFFPINLHMERASILSKPIFYPEILFYVFFAGSFILGFVYTKRFSKKIFFALGWFLILIFPNLGVFIPLNAGMAEHWLYLPSFGFFSALALFIYWFLDKQKAALKLIINLILVVILLILSEISFKQTFYWENAMTFFTKTVESSPRSSKARLGLGLAYLGNGNDKNAKIEFMKMAALDPKNASLSHNNMALIYTKQGKFDEAEKQYKQAIKEDPKFAGAYNNLASLYLKEGLLDKAYDCLEKSLSLNPDFVEPYYNLGMLYRAKNETLKEFEYFKKATQVDPDYAPALEGLAGIYLGSNDYAEAKKILMRILKVRPGDSNSRFKLGTIYLKEKKYKTAEKQYRDALKYDPGFHACRINFAIVLYEMGKIRESIDEYKTILKSVPDHEKANYNLGLIYKQTGRFDEALECFKKVVKTNPSNEKAREKIKQIEALSRGIQE